MPAESSRRAALSEKEPVTRSRPGALSSCPEMQHLSCSLCVIGAIKGHYEPWV